MCWKSPVWWLFWHRRPCVCTTSAGRAESRHNHRESEALMNLEKHFMCVFVATVIRPLPFVNWPIWQGLWLSPCTDICIYVSDKQMMPIVHMLLWSLKPSPHVGHGPWFGFVPHYQSQLAGSTPLQISMQGFFMCSSVFDHWGELWCYSALPLLRGLSLHT